MRAGIAAERAHRVAHRGQVDDGRDAGEVLEQDPRRRERDLAARLLCRDPCRDGLHVRRVTAVPVLEPQDVLEQDPQRVREAGDVVARPAGRRGGRSRSSRPPTASVAAAPKLSAIALGDYRPAG